MTRRGFVLALSIALAGAPTTSALGATYVEVRAGWGGGDGVFARSSDDPLLTGEPVVSGVAIDKEEGGSVSLSDQPLLICDMPGCSLLLPATGLVLSRAEANGLNGVLRGRAVALGGDDPDGPAAGSESEVLARLTDTLTFTGSNLLFEFDIDLMSVLTDLGRSDLTFRFGLPAVTPPFPCPDCVPTPSILTELNVFAYRDDSLSERGYNLFRDGTLIESGDFIEDRFEFSYDFAVPPCLPLFGFVCPPPGTPNTTNFFFELETAAEIFEGNGIALMAADQSAFIKVANATSLNGYSYLGRPGNEAIPEPATWALLIMGFAFIGAALRQQRHRPMRPLAN